MHRGTWLAVVVAMTPLCGFAWSAPGHRAIATAAFAMLPAETRTKVLAILDGDTPEAASTWLDQIREGSIHDQEMEQDFPQNSKWHFVDYPVGSTAYDFASRYSDPNDVVHALEMAIGVVEGKPSRLTKQKAMRTIIHLVGDIHQPLHCGTGFYDISDHSKPRLLNTAGISKSSVSDRGGNQLYFSESEELHAMWDKTLPGLVGSTPAKLVAKLKVPDFKTQFVTTGDYHHWAETWAGETMQEFTAAYKDIQYKSAAYVPDTNHPGQTMLQIMIDLPGGTETYKAAQEQRTQAQLTKAAVHLAQLLSAIKLQ